MAPKKAPEIFLERQDLKLAPHEVCTLVASPGREHESTAYAACSDGCMRSCAQVARIRSPLQNARRASVNARQAPITSQALDIWHQVFVDTPVFRMGGVLVIEL